LGDEGWKKAVEMISYADRVEVKAKVEIKDKVEPACLTTNFQKRDSSDSQAGLRFIERYSLSGYSNLYWGPNNFSLPDRWHEETNGKNDAEPTLCL
jgi:hypothetical protein